MVKCKYCNKELSSKQRLKTHIESKVCRKYKCNICKMNFSSKTKYNNHRRKPCGKIYICNICGFETKHQSSFSRHINKTCKIKNKIKLTSQSGNINKYDSKYNINSLEELKNMDVIHKSNNQRPIYINIDKIDNSFNTTVNNNTVNINTNIHINNFCEENTDYIGAESLKHMLNHMHPYDVIVEFIKTLNFNDNHPENRTIEMINIKKKKIAVIRNGIKEIMDRDKAYQMKIINADNFITEKIAETKSIDKQYNTSVYFLKKDIERYEKDYDTRRFNNYTDIRQRIDGLLESHKRFGRVNQHPLLQNMNHQDKQEDEKENNEENDNKNENNISKSLINDIKVI